MDRVGDGRVGVEPARRAVACQVLKRSTWQYLFLHLLHHDPNIWHATCVFGIVVKTTDLICSVERGINLIFDLSIDRVMQFDLPAFPDSKIAEIDGI
jgi:hypothetical protein